MLPQPALFTGATPVLAPQVLTDLPDMLLDATLNTQLALALLRHMVQPVIVMDPDGRVTLVNAAGMALISPPAVSALEGRFWGDLWPHADSADLRAALAQATSGEIAAITLDCRRAVASAATLMPLEDDAGRVVKILCLLRAR